MLPARVSFVGRDRESAHLASLLRDAPVVTLSGPGGVGKTTLAAHVAEQMADEFADGVRWVDLAPMEPGASVALAAAAALGGRAVTLEEAESGLPALVAGRQLLVVLDNCEHVIAGAAAVASHIAASPDARVLATSRESLGLPEEHVLALEPLALPDGDSTDAVREAAATRLFAERAAAVRTGFELRDDNAADVARLCRRLDGLPLAVELAAARARSLSPREIADRLDERFVLLAHRKSRAADRHRSMRAAVDWSYGLLTPSEQRLFARLGVFSTSVGVVDVEAVCCGESGGVLDVLDQLVDRSLVTAREVGGTTRYGMLETLRAYARERLAEGDGLASVRDRHADHYVTVADSLRLEELRGWEATSFARLSALEDPLAALRWCVAQDAAPGRAFHLLAPMWAVVHSRAAAEVTDLAERALARWSDVDDPLAVQALGVAAVGHFVLGRPERARERALEAIGDGRDAVIARRALALVAYHFPRDVDEADRLLADVIAVAERCGASGIAIEMTPMRALVLAARGDAEAGTALATAARERAEHVGALYRVAWSTYVLGVIGLGWGHADQARAPLERSLELARAVDYPLVVGGSLRQLGVLVALEGDRQGAAELLREALRHWGAIGDRVQLWETLRSVAIACAAAGARDVAERLLDGAGASAVARGLAPIERALLERVLPERSGAVGAGEPLEQLTRVAAESLAAWEVVAAGPASGPAPATATGVFRRDGPLWTLAFAGVEVRMPHLKGLTDLATLVANPGREIHCLELAGEGPVVAGEGDLGEVLDARAREAYQARVEELRTDIEAARRANDPVREERARDELGTIAEALEAAYGLGGRVRRTGDPAERARTAVAWRVRSAVRKVEAEHAVLARHLRNSVRMGTWCAYDPEVPVRWEL